MAQNRDRTPAENFAERKRRSGVWDLLEDYMDIRDELEETLNSIEWLHEEIQFAMEDINEQLEDLQQHMYHVSDKLRRFKTPKAEKFKVVKDQDALPFD